MFLVAFCFTRVNSDILSLNSIAFLEIKNYVSHWIQHKIISKDLKQSFWNSSLVFWLIWEYWKQKNINAIFFLSHQKRSWRENFGTALLQGKKIWEWHLKYHINHCCWSFSIHCHTWSSDPRETTEQYGLSCLAKIKEINNLKFTDGFVLHAAGFHSIHCCWQESGWNFDEDWITVDKV